MYRAVLLWQRCVQMHHNTAEHGYPALRVECAHSRDSKAVVSASSWQGENRSNRLDEAGAEIADPCNAVPGGHII